MAPEVALNQPYDERVDVYSFGILFWEILALETPFDKFTMSMFQKTVVRGGTRPKIDPKWPEEISNIIRLCWATDIAKRPDMERVVTVLRNEIQSKGDEEISDIMDASRKSELSLRGNSNFKPIDERHHSSYGGHHSSRHSQQSFTA
jgi:serine/threonine protein kinase